MLFKVKDLEGIKSGHISLAFRKWKSARAKEGSLIKTAVGLVKINGIAPIEKSSISEAEALKAGYQDLNELHKILDSRSEGTIFRIEVAYYSADLRLALREESELGDDEFERLRTKLANMDKRSKEGPWTTMVLIAIKENPELRALDLSAKIGKTKEWLKPNIRKLKNLGLTISMGTGYRISPRGEAFLERLS